MLKESKFNIQDKDNIAIAYLRVSTYRQEKKGYSIEQQKASIEAYAKENGLKIIDFYQEPKSASKINDSDAEFTNANIYTALSTRPQLKEIVKLARKRKFKHLLVFSRDRLVRNFELFVKMSAFFAKQGVHIHYTKPSEKIDTEDNIIGQLMELVIASIAELESSLISDRVKSSLTQKVKSGSWAGGIPPYGYIVNKKVIGSREINVLQPSLLEMNDVMRIFQLYNTYGYSLRKIAEIMNEKNNSKIWTKGKIESILKNETYTATLTWNRRSRKKGSVTDIVRSDEPIKNASIISKDQWQDSVNLRETKSNQRDSKYLNTPYLLKNKLVCGYCGKELKPINRGRYKSGTSRGNVYRCPPDEKFTDSHLILKQNIVEDKFVSEFLNAIGPMTIDGLWERYANQMQEEIEQNQKKLIKIYDEIKQKEETIKKIDKHLKDNSTSEMYVPLQNEQKLLKNELEILNKLRSGTRAVISLPIPSKNKLHEALEKFLHKDFILLESTTKRLIIDLLVDKVIVYKKDDSISLQVQFKSNFDSL